MKYWYIIFSITLSIPYSCGSKNAEQTSAASNAVAEQFIDGKGKLLEVEDSGYPFAYLVIDIAQTNKKEYFDINLEEVKDTDLEKLRNLKGQNIQFTYNTSFSNTLMDIEVNGKSLFPDNLYKKLPETQKVEGTLSGADMVTPGDLPGKIIITSSSGQKFPFDFFATEDMVKVNGKNVSVYYEITSRQNIVNFISDTSSK